MPSLTWMLSGMPLKTMPGGGVGARGDAEALCGGEGAGADGDGDFGDGVAFIADFNGDEGIRRPGRGGPAWCAR